MLLTDTKAVPIMNETFNNLFGFMDIGGAVPVLLIWTIVVLFIGYFSARTCRLAVRHWLSVGMKSAIYSGST